METLKTGCLAFFDTFAGLVPVKVLSVTAPEKLPSFDLGHGNARASIRVTSKVTADHSPYKKGEVIENDSIHMVPRGAIIRGKFSSAIGVYNVEADAQVKAGAALQLQAAA